MIRWWVESPRIHFLTLSWALVILMLSAMPGRDMPALSFENLDKAAHLIVYAVLAVLMAFSFRAIGNERLVHVLIYVTIYGLLIEWMQGAFFEGRYFDLYDGISNGIGALIGIVIFKRLDRTF